MLPDLAVLCISLPVCCPSAVRLPFRSLCLGETGSGIRVGWRASVYERQQCRVMLSPCLGQIRIPHRPSRGNEPSRAVRSPPRQSSPTLHPVRTDSPARLGELRLRCASQHLASNRASVMHLARRQPSHTGRSTVSLQHRSHRQQRRMTQRDPPICCSGGPLDWTL